MKKIFLSLLACVFLQNLGTAQINWKEYSERTYFGQRPKGDTTPSLLIAVPRENESFWIFTKYKSRVEDSLMGNPGFAAHRNTHTLFSLDTYDSSDAHIFAPGITPSNAKEYQYRILLNGTKIVVPWRHIGRFSEYTMSTTKSPMGYLGGYKTIPGNFLVVDLRKKGQDSILASAIICWKSIKPVLLDIYTADELNKFLNRLKDPWPYELSSNEIKKWESLYPEDKIDSATHLPKKLVLNPGQNNIIFYLKAQINDRKEVEYSLLKGGAVYYSWQSNDFDNSFIWFKNLLPGNYVLKIRYSIQRQNVASYPFKIKPAWYQKNSFRLIIGLLAASFATMAVLLIIVFWQRRKRRARQSENEKLYLKLKTLRSQLNPHFIFNALNSIQGLVNKNELSAANIYLSEFGNLMRGSLSASGKDYIPLNMEISSLETYLKLEQLRFRFTYDIVVDEAINTSDTEIPSLILQPLVENAVKHGVSAKREKGIIQIYVSKKNDAMEISITDNGNGFQPVRDKKGYGLKLTKERIVLLNQVLKGQSIKLDIQENKASGTKVFLQFKNWL